MFFKKLEEYIQMNHRYFDKDEREILFYSKLSSFFLGVFLTQEEFERECIFLHLNKHFTYDCTEPAYHKN